MSRFIILAMMMISSVVVAKEYTDLDLAVIEAFNDVQESVYVLDRIEDWEVKQ